ncbi:TraM recognition domain-containing protein, partial [Pseudonocardia sp. KRD-182]|uniref:type IV secretory system conjugative DNA transfer family protein n=1 Tax=Pseudonocardia oceani TaxID=2792013 RepID=UPI001C49CF31
AAALGGKTIHDVGRWLGDEGEMQREVPALLRRSPVPAFEQDLGQFLGTNPNTRTSITSTVAPALNWLNQKTATEAVKGSGFDVAELLASKATVFLLGGEETQTAPLVCALTGHIAREARRLAALSPKGRLDPHLTLALDEAALISPVPLESWTADMGGRGVTIIAAFQSRAQLLARWGEHATATILNNTAAVMVFGGTRDRDDLNFWSTLAGERDEPALITDMHGRLASRSTRRVPVLPPAQLANLPAGRVLLVRRGIAPVIGRVVMAWHRRDVREQVFHRDHPVAVARIGGARARMRRPVRVVASAVGRGTAAISGAVGRWPRGVGARVAAGWRWLVTDPHTTATMPGRRVAAPQLPRSGRDALDGWIGDGWWT